MENNTRMRRLIYIIPAVIVLGYVLSMLDARALSTAVFAKHTRYRVCFTPGRDCTQQVVNLIHKTKHTLYLQAYSFTSRRIARALVAAAARGVRVAAIVDHSQLFDEPHSQLVMLLQHRIPVWQDNSVNIAHNKVMISDRSAIETGSFNYTYSADHFNAENVLVIYSKQLALSYLLNWKKRQRHSVLIKPEQYFKQRRTRHLSWFGH